MNNWRVVPYMIFGVKLYAVENNGYIFKYCNTRKDAQDCCDTKNGVV